MPAYAFDSSNEAEPPEPVLPEFSDRVPPEFEHLGDYGIYRAAALHWMTLTTLAPRFRGAAMMSRFCGETQSLMINLSSVIEDIRGPNGAQVLIYKLDDIFDYAPFNFAPHLVQFDIEEAFLRG